MTAPDEDPAIAARLDEAAQLATAVSARLDEALAIAERNATFNEDRACFKSRPDRSCRVRLTSRPSLTYTRSDLGGIPPSDYPMFESLLPTLAV